MNDQNDDAQNFALMVLAGVLALVIAGVLALAISTTMGRAGAGAGASAGAGAVPGAAGGAAVPELGVADARVYFELGSDALPADAQAELTKLADAARADAGKAVLISGYHDASGDPAKNAELAKSRALVVRHALEANGVAKDRLVMDKPRVTLGGTDPREARRVEMRLR